jgi:hypothetical protein
VKRPKTRAQWQAAVDLAEFFIHLEAAGHYGLITGGPGADVGRCERLLRDGRRRGVRPTPGCVERITARFMAAVAVEPWASAR